MKKFAAVIGYGGMGGWHTQHLLKSDVFELAGIYDIKEERRALAEKNGIHAYASREELLALLHSEEVRNYPWIADENQRKLRFRELINSGDREALMGMIGALHRHKKAQLAAGRKFHQSDENFLSDAQKLLNAEFSQVFDLAPGQVSAFILKELENTH